MAEEVPAQFTRFEQEDLEGRLETAEVSFVHSGTACVVTLVGMIHIAEHQYYEDIQRDLKAYDIVCFEGVTGSYKPLARVIESYELLGEKFNLQLQSKVMKRAPNFVHADLSVDQIVKAIGPKDFSQDLDSKELSDLEQLLGKRSSNEHLKWAVAEGLSKAVGSEDRHMFIRNEHCMKIVQAEIARRKSGRFAIMYGTAHMGDFSKRLKALGFKPVSVRWRAAWRINRFKKVEDQLDEMKTIFEETEENKPWKLFERGINLLLVLLGGATVMSVWRSRKQTKPDV